MSDFFKEMEKRGLLSSCVECLDWLFTGEKMQGWDRASKCRFTKEMKTMKYLSKKMLHCKDGTPYPNPQKAGSRPRSPIIVMKSNGSEGHDFIRHLRNSIAHGNATVYKVPYKETYLEARDSKSDSKTQTAYIAIPLETLISLMKLYRKQERKLKHR